MQDKVEFEFDMNVIDAVKNRPITFKNFCNRYKNDAELGARIRQITNEVCEKKAVIDSIVAIAALAVLDYYINAPEKKKRRFWF